MTPYKLCHTNVGAVFKCFFYCDIVEAMLFTVIHNPVGNPPCAAFKIDMIIQLYSMVLEEGQHGCKLECRSWLRSPDRVIKVFDVFSILLPAQVGNGFYLSRFHFHHYTGAMLCFIIN